jgi:sugar phosphate isomerase/epimerase
MLCYSTGSLPDAATLGGPHDVADALAHWLLPTPFRGIEFVVRPEHLRRADDTGFWHALRVGLEVRGLCVRNVHLGYPRLLGGIPHRPGLSALVPELRALRREAALAAAQVAKHLGSPHLTLTTGPAERTGALASVEARTVATRHDTAVLPGSPFARPWPHFAAGALSPDFACQWRAVVDELAALVANKPREVILLIEQEPEMAVHSALQLAELGWLFEGEVFANYDVGHGAVIGEDLPAALTLLQPYLRNVHLEDIAGREHRHLLFGAGEIDFGSIFSALKHIGYAGDITPDLYPFCEKPREGLAASIECLSRHGQISPLAGQPHL